MISLSLTILVATCTATLGLHSSSSTTSSYSYFDAGSALRSRTARSAELRPPRPLTDTPPVSGPMKPTLTLSLAIAGSADRPRPSTPASTTAGTAGAAADSTADRKLRGLVIVRLMVRSFMRWGSRGDNAEISAIPPWEGLGSRLGSIAFSMGIPCFFLGANCIVFPTQETVELRCRRNFPYAQSHDQARASLARANGNSCHWCHAERRHLPADAHGPG